MLLVHRRFGQNRLGLALTIRVCLSGGVGVGGGARGFIPNGFLTRKKMPALGGHSVLVGLLADLRLNYQFNVGCSPCCAARAIPALQHCHEADWLLAAVT
jgi:hypothetical protein